MSKTEFTQGPWAIDKRMSSSLYVCRESNGEGVCEVDCTMSPEGEDLRTAPTRKETANAHLIAAAPDLYSQLECMIRAYESEIHDKYDGCSILDEMLSVTKDARAALLKARGELTQAAEV